MNKIAWIAGVIGVGVFALVHEIGQWIDDICIYDDEEERDMWSDDWDEITTLDPQEYLGEQIRRELREREME